MEEMAHFFSFKTSKVGWLKFLFLKNWPIILIIFLASFLRLYRISDYMTFLGDEGRDVLIAKGLLEGKFTLLGPRASAGDFFLGPFYYYLMAPFLWLSRLDPVGPAIMVALIGIATVFLIYKVTKEFLDFKSAIFASTLYAVSPLVISYSRSSWNPNPMPFVSLLTLYLTYKALIKDSWKLFIAIGFLLGIALQLHYLGTFLIIIVGVFILIGRFYLEKAMDVSGVLKRYSLALVGFLVGISPFLAFELRHGFPNSKTIVNFVLGNVSGAPPYTGSTPFVDVVKDVVFRLFGRLVVRFPEQQHFFFYDKETILIWQLAVIVIALFSIFLLLRIKNKLAAILFSTWFILGIILFGFYKKPIYDYYFGFMFPLPFILVGNFISNLISSSRQILKPLGVTIFVGLFLLSLGGNPFRYEPNRQKDQVRKISEFVISKTDGKPFNFALLTPGNSDHGYRYYFEILGHPDTRMENINNDPERKTVTDQLLIVCEDPDCKPLGHPLFEISNFGRAEIVGEWQVSVVKVFKLVHYRE